MNQAVFKKLVKKYFLALSIPGAMLVCIGAAFIVIDPLQLFHKSFFMPPNMLSPNMREQAAGLIRNYDFDSIILGTSVLQNTSAEEAGRKLGGKFMNLSIEGGSYYERSFLLGSALRKGLRSVIYSADDHYLGPYMDSSIYPAREWAYLYDGNPFNDIRRYATLQNVLALFDANRGLSAVDLDYPRVWFKKGDTVMGFGGPEKWAENADDVFVRDILRKDLPETAAKAVRREWKVARNREREAKAIKYIDDHILSFVKKYPHTQFHIVLPPYFRYRYARWLQTVPEDFYVHQEAIRYLAGKTGELPNLHVYGFEDEDFPDDIANYKDPVHFHPDINSRILDAIAAGKNSLNAGNVKKYLDTSAKKAWNFDIGALNERLSTLLPARNSDAKQQ